jgi:hypothetical protein
VEHVVWVGPLADEVVTIADLEADVAALFCRESLRG